ncbi:hypothetical protein ACNOYE_34870 [Nannocystaceae bacterium ST9]
MQDALDAVIRLPVVQVGRKAMTTRGLPFRDFVVFTAKGEDFCRAYRSAAECDDPVAVTWAMQDVFGVAVIEFENPAAPRVARFRFMSESSLIPSSSERAGQTFDSTRVVGWITHIALEALTVEDVDGDASDEYVILVSHDSLSPNSEEGPEAVYEIFHHRRLMVFREDLTLEADGYVQQIWSQGAPGWSIAHDFVRESLTFRRPTATSPGAIVLEWCETDPMLDDCPLDIRCGTPTERVIVEYDPAGDNFPKARQEKLRSPTTHMDEACD